MDRKYPKKRLMDAGVQIYDCDHKTPKPKESGYPYIAIPNIVDGRIELADVRLISEEDYIEWTRRTKPRAGDIIVTRRGRVGDTAVIPEGLECAIGQNLVILRSKTEEVSQEYLRWALRGKEYQDEVFRYLNVGAIFDSLNVADIPKFELPIPPLPEQRAIAEILGSLDDKIEANRHQNETLEATARAIFKSWFVDFDPVHAKARGEHPPGMDTATAALFPDSFEESELGLIPSGWGVGTLGDVADFNTWTLSKKDKLDQIEYVEISEVMRGEIGTIKTFVRGEEPSRARRRLQHGDTVLSTVRPDRGAYFLCLNPSPFLIASTGFVVFTPTNDCWSFLHAALIRPEIFERLGALADGAAYPAVAPEMIAALPIVIPSPELMIVFHEISGPLYEQAEQNRVQSRTLAETRDALLPRLVSGELRVGDVEV